MISLVTEYFLAIALFFSFISLIFYGLTFDPRNLVQTEQTSGLGIVFTTIYRIISSVIPVKVVVFSMVGLFTIFGDSIRTGLQPDVATQDRIQVAQPVPNSILVSFILNGARAGVIFRRRLMESPQALMDLVSLVNPASMTDEFGEGRIIFGAWEPFIGYTVTVYCGYVDLCGVEYLDSLKISIVNEE